MHWHRTRRRREREIAAELALHVALRTDANRAAGLDAEAAGRDAARRLGSDLALRERTREAATPRLWMWLEDAARDLSLAGRALRRSRGFTVLAVATLALGIGAATAMFSVVHIVLLDPLPFPHAQRLVQILSLERVRPGGSRIIGVVNVTQRALAPLRQSGIFADVGIFGYTPDPAIFVQGSATDAFSMLASPRAFQTLGVTPELGRGFSAGAGARLREMIVSDEFWRTALHSDRTAIGKPLRVGDAWYTLVGVLPPAMGYPAGVDAWLAGVPAPGDDGVILASLKSDLPLAKARQQAEAAVEVIGKRLAPPGDKRGMTGLGFAPHLYYFSARPQARTALWVLLAAVGCLLLIACANTASLLLVRGLARERELAVRRALGASRARVLRLLLAEGLWLALAGGLGGAALAWLFVRLARLGPASVPRLDAARLDPVVLGFAALAALACGLACAMAPALRLSEPNLSSGLHDGGLVTRTARLRLALMVAEVALTMVLLIGGVLLLGSFNRLLHDGPGFRVRQMTALEVIVPPPPPKVDNKQLFDQRQRQDQALLERLRTLPGVQAATYSTEMPFDRLSGADISLPGQKVTPDNFRDFTAGGLSIGPGFVTTMGIRLLAGRELGNADMVSAWAPDTPILINAALAKRLWPHRPVGQAVGKRVKGPGGGKDDLAVVVGVVANTRNTSDITDNSQPQFYAPVEGNDRYTEFLLRSPLPAAALLAEVRPVLAQVNPQLNLGAPVTLEAAMQQALGQPRFQALLLDIFAALALLLALVGLYGALAYQVRQRRREIGVRMALGASDRAVLRLVLGQSLAVLAAGIAAGWLLAWLASRYIASLLFNISAFDPSSWAAASAALLAAGLLASYVPARRALRVDAAEVLRCE